MPPEVRLEPVTARHAADLLEKAPSTIRCWAVRYGARQLKKVGKVVFYDFADLAVIDRELKHGHPIPATWQERARIANRCPHAAADRSNQAA